MRSLGLCRVLFGAIVLATIAGSSPAQTPKATQPVSFRAVHGSDVMEIDFKSQGCFHNRIYKLRFTANPQPKIEIRNFSSGENPRRSTTVTLTRPQVQRLDNLISCYSKPRTTSSSTRESITFTMHRRGKPDRVISYVDESNASGFLADAHPDDLKGTDFAGDRPVLELFRLCHTADQMQEKGITRTRYTELPRRSTLAFLMRGVMDTKKKR